MIKKAIGFTIFLLFLWGVYINYQPFSYSQHQWQGNIIRAEKFIYDMDSIDNLIVGSSLAKRIEMDSLSNFYNLSFSGQGIFDGLNILRNKRNLPCNVFVETNFILRDENSNFKGIILSPMLNILKANSSIFRTDKQPLALIPAKLEEIFNKSGNKIKTDSHVSDITKENTTESSIFNKRLAITIESYSENIDTLMMDKQFTKLKKQVEFLESKGVNVIFFEMPVHPKLIELKRSIYLRERVRYEFPNASFIELPKNCEIYHTSDGLHLTGDEPELYTSYFKHEAITIANGLQKRTSDASTKSKAN